MAKEILGHIDCPHCGYTDGMRITLDKSGAPFGFCEANCNGQMRIGGNVARVKAFYAKHPHLKAPEDSQPAPAAVAPAPAEKKPAAPVKVEKEAPPKKAAPRITTLLEQIQGANA